MLLSRVMAASLRSVRLLADWLISPFGYNKELIGLAVILGVFLWLISAAATSLSPKDATQNASTGFPTVIALNEDGEWLAAGTSTGEIRAFHQGQPAWTRTAQRLNIRSLAIAHNRDQLVSGGLDGKISIRSLTTGDDVRELTP